MAQNHASNQSEIKLDGNLKIFICGKKDGWKNHEYVQTSDLKSFFEDGTKEGLTFQQRISLPPFPPTLVLAQLSKLVYENKLENQKATEIEFPDNKWRILACARNKKNCYLAAVFLNSDTAQIIIAHKGTKWTNLGDLSADVTAVIRNKHHSQINSAITFALCMKNIFQEINPHLRISVTGHSLGGYLGQLSTFAMKHLRVFNDDLEAIKASSEGYHAHCVVFDSPGCEAMMGKLKDQLDLRYDSCINNEHLDITSYLSAPNIINTRNLHIGTLYRIFPDLSKCKNWKYTFECHSIKNIVQIFKKNEIAIHKVRDWPLCKHFLRSKEYKQFFNTATKLNNYHPEDQDCIFDNSTRYRTKKYDSNSCAINVFTQQEFFLLQTWKQLKNSKLTLEELEKFVHTQKLREYPDLLDKVDVRTTELTCGELDKLISFTKLIPLFYPEAIEIIKQQATAEPSVLQHLIQSESGKYAQKLEAFIQKEIAFHDTRLLEDFINGPKSVLQVVTSDTVLETGWIRNVLHQLTKKSEEQEANSRRIFLDWGQLLNLQKFVDLQGIFKLDPPVGDVMVVEYPFEVPCDEKLRKKILDICKNSKIKKIIFVTKPRNDIGEYMEGKGADVCTTDRSEVRLRFDDLSKESRQRFLEKVLLHFEKRKLTLGELLNIEKTTPIKNELVSQEMLKDLLSGNCDPVEVDEGRLDEIDLEGCCEQVYENVTRQELRTLLSCDDAFEKDKYPKLSFFTGLCQSELSRILEATEQKIEELIQKDSVMISTEEQFQRTCLQHPDRTIFWFHAVNQIIQCRMIYDSRLYIKRSFQAKIISAKIAKEFAKTDDKFIISYEEDKQKPAEILKLDQNYPNLMLSSKANAAAEFDGCDSNGSAVHWIECDDRGRLLWRRSKGSLRLIKKFIDEEEMNCVDETKIMEKLDRVTIITDEPGMGKTTSLANFCRNLRSSWVIRITLRNSIKQIKQLPETLDMCAAVSFLQQNSSKLNDDRIRKLFQLSLENDNPIRIVLLFDGFDEITSEKDLTHPRQNVLSSRCLALSSNSLSEERHREEILDVSIQE